MSVFEILGLSPVEEAVYRLLLGGPGTSGSEIARRTSLASTTAHKALVSLESKGLIGRSPGKRAHFFAISPGVALESLARQRWREVDEARAGALDIAKELLESDSGEELSDILEVVHGRQAVYQRFLQLDLVARDEVMVLSKPPYVLTTTESEREQLSTGIKYRYIYDRDALEYPAHLSYLTGDIAAGEQARVVPELPMKLMIVDRREALMSLDVRRPDVNGALIVRASPLLDALIVLFETLWEKALPLNLGRADADESRAELTAKEQELLALLASGITDEAIARHLDVTTRTLRRRVSELLEKAGALTRFQLALQGTRRGWIGLD